MSYLIIFTFIISTAFAESGFVERAIIEDKNTTFSIRTGTENLTVKLPTSSKEAKYLQKFLNSREIAPSLNFPADSVERREVVVNGIRPDCSELPVSIKSLNSIATDPRVKNIEDFLNKLPGGSFQSFTLVTNSLSIQQGEKDKGRVSSQWPRVIRSSIDGKITMSYVCDPSSGSYNKVEIIYFDDALKKFQTMSYDLTKDSKKGSHRTESNSKTCLGCHASNSAPDTVKPIWPSYPRWGGCDKNKGITVYGANDDIMNATSPRKTAENKNSYPGCVEDENRNKAEMEEQILEFKKFRKLQENNPCYSLLPWPKNDSREKKDLNEFYPYNPAVTNTKETDGSLRTNLRFTSNYSKLYSQQILERLKKDPLYDKLKYYIAMESSGCIKQSDLDDLASVAGNLRTPYGMLANEMTNPLLYKFSQMAGFSKEDWSLEFKPAVDDTYGTGTDLTMGVLVGSKVFFDVIENDTDLRSLDRPNRYLSGVYDNSRFSCLNDLGGDISYKIQKDVQKNYCKLLRKKAKDSFDREAQCWEFTASCCRGFNRDIASIVQGNGRAF